MALAEREYTYRSRNIGFDDVSRPWNTLSEYNVPDEIAAFITPYLSEINGEDAIPARIFNMVKGHLVKRGEQPRDSFLQPFSPPTDNFSPSPYKSATHPLMDMEVMNENTRNRDTLPMSSEGETHSSQLLHNEGIIFESPRKKHHQVNPHWSPYVTRNGDMKVRGPGRYSKRD